MKQVFEFTIQEIMQTLAESLRDKGAVKAGKYDLELLTEVEGGRATKVTLTMESKK